MSWDNAQLGEMNLELFVGIFCPLLFKTRFSLCCEHSSGLKATTRWGKLTLQTSHTGEGPALLGHELIFTHDTCGGLGVGM